MKRHEGLDALRALLLLYIVAFWHGFEYAPLVTWHVNKLTSILTNAALGSFLMLSGYFIGFGWRKYDTLAVSLGEKSRRLLVDRMKRLYPLYLLALLLFWAIGLVDGWGTLKAMLLISAVLKPAPQTLWFVLTLLTLTLLSPIWLAAMSNAGAYLVRFLVVFAIAVAYAIATGQLDSRIVLYMPGFALGLWWGGKHVTAMPSRVMVLSVAGMIVGIIWLILAPEQRKIVAMARDMLVLLPLSILFLGVALRYPSLGQAFTVFDMLAYTGYAAYLFHRPVYMLLTHLYQPANELAQILYVLLVCMPVILAAAYGVQRLFDVAIHRYGAHQERVA